MTSISDLQVAIPSDKSPSFHAMCAKRISAPRAGGGSPVWCLDEAPVYPVIHPHAPAYEVDMENPPPSTYLSKEVAYTYGYLLARALHDDRFNLQGKTGDAFLVERMEKKMVATTLIYDYIVILHPAGRWMTVAIYEKGESSSFPFRHYNTINA
jgi:hypothetical protein